MSYLAYPACVNRFIACLLANAAAYPFHSRDVVAPELFAAKDVLSPTAESGRIG